VRMTAKGPVSGELPLDYHLRAPCASTHEENYRLHAEEPQVRT
jgi:hypothetical protein